LAKKGRRVGADLRRKGGEVITMGIGSRGREKGSLHLRGSKGAKRKGG